MLIRFNGYVNTQEVNRKITFITANGERYSAFDMTPANNNSTSFTYSRRKAPSFRAVI